MKAITKTIGNITINFQEEKFNKNKSYNRLDAVTQDGVNWFVAKINVPQNIELTNTKYWYNFIDLVETLENIRERITIDINSNVLNEKERAKNAENEITEALTSHIENCDNPHNVTKEQIGLGNNDNTSDMDKPVSTAQQKAIDDAYANSNKYTDQKIADLINGAPETLDTLKEVADAITESKSVEEALNAAIGTKANQAELDTHTDNDTIHITSDERTKWNDANGKKHSHNNKSVLDGITSTLITSWNTITEKLDKTGDASNVTSTITTTSTRENITAGEKLSVLLGKIAKWFTDLKEVAFTGSYNDLNDIPETFAPSSHKQAFTASECTAWTTDDGYMGVTPAAVKKAVNSIEIGGRNLFLSTDKEISNNEYLLATYLPASDPLIAGQIYTITICVTPAQNVSGLGIYLSSGYQEQCEQVYVNGTSKQIVFKTFKANYSSGRTPDDNISHANLCLYRKSNGTVSSNTTVHWVKVEKGNKSTDWTPAPEDTVSSALKATSVVDYGDSSRTIQIGYAGSSLTPSEIVNIAGYTGSGTNFKIKDINKANLQSWLGLGSLAYDSSIPKATSDTLGGVKIGNNITNTDGTISITDENIKSALGYTPSQLYELHHERIIGGVTDDYTSFVIGLCEWNDASEADIIASGFLYLKRPNGNTASPTARADFCLHKVYNSTTPQGGLISFNNSILKLCTFTYNEQQYLGLDITYVFSSYSHLYLNYVSRSKTKPFAVKYYNRNTSTVINSEIKNSLKDYSWSSPIYMNNNCIRDGAFKQILSGTSEPDSSIGNDGDLYFVIEE